MRRTFHFWLLAALAVLAPACGGNGGNNKPPNTLASAPTSLTVAQKTTARVDLTWIPGSTNEFEFRIERSDDLGANYSLVGTATRGSTAYSDFGLLANKTYYYRVTAWNSVGNSPFAGPVIVTTKPLAWSTTTNLPVIRADHSAIYDSAGKRMVVFGGVDEFFTPYNDLWALDLKDDTLTLSGSNHWSPLTASGTPPTQRFGHSAIYDVQHNRMILFGGEDISSTFKFDVYVLDLGSSPAWAPASTSGSAPSARIGHTAIYDAANQRMVVFGGNEAPGTSEKADCFFLSLPSGTSFVWTQAPAGPSKRTEHSAAYDGLRQQMVIFGGIDHLPQTDGSDLNGETWSLNLASPLIWNQFSFSGTPQFREGQTAIYDSPNQRVMMFGGDTTLGPGPTASSELWALRLDTTPAWLFQAPTSGNPPPSRYGHTAVYDSGWQRMIIFGGYDSSGFPTFPDAWVADF